MSLDIHLDPFFLMLIMTIELGIGASIGWIMRGVVKLKARNSSERFQVFKRGEYTSRSYGDSSPYNSLSTFGLDSDLIIVETNNGEVVKELFYTPLGDYIKVEYKDDGGESESTSFLSAPLYAVMVVFPLIIGFILFAIVAQLSDDSFSHAHEAAVSLANSGVCLLISGLVWLAVAYSIPGSLSLSARLREKTYPRRQENSLASQIESETTKAEEYEANWIERFFWIFLILGAVTLALFWYLQSLKYISKNPDLESGYRTLILGFLFWANIPWLVIGMGYFTNNLTLKDYLKPRSVHPYLIAFSISLLFVFSAGSYWLFTAGGAEMLVRYPGLLISNSGEALDSQSLNPQTIKIWWASGVISGVASMTFLLIKAVRSSSPS